MRTALVVLQQLEDCEHDVVGVAETACLALFSMVQPARPVDRHVAMSFVQLDGAANGASRGGLAECVEPVKDRRVFADIEAL